jgi:acyl-CoA thioesterase
MEVGAPHLFESSLSLEGGDGHYELLVDPTWEGQPGVVYGGFTLAVVVRAAGLESSAGRPVSLACQFLRALTPTEPVNIEVTAIRRGRASDLLQVTLTQSGKTAVVALIRTTTASSGPVCDPPHTPDLGDPASVRLALDLMREDGWERIAPFHYHVEYRQDPSRPDTDYVSWGRLGNSVVYDDPFMEGARFAFALDQQAPAILNRLGYFFGAQRSELPWGFTNLDLLVHFHRPRATDWLCSISRVIDGHDGIGSAQTQVWSRTGELVATGLSQVAFFPTTGDRLFG